MIFFLSVSLAWFVLLTNTQGVFSSIFRVNLLLAGVYTVAL